MAKRKNVSGNILRNAVPKPKDVAEFVVPRTVENGLSLQNVFGDIGDMINPFITAAIEKQEGLRNVSDDELKLLATLGLLPIAGTVGGKLLKNLNKMVPNPKGGFIRVKSGDKLKNILQELKDKGQGLSPEQETKLRSAIGDYNNFMRTGDKSIGRRLIKFQNNTELDPELKQAYVAFLESKNDNSLGGLIVRDAVGYRGITKPIDFESWTPDERIKYIKDRMEFHGGSLDDLSKPLYKEHPDYGVLTDNSLRIEDYHKALLDKKAEEAARPITTTQVQEASTGILPVQSSVPQGGTRPTYDHSRQFMDTELKQVPGIDRTGMSYGDETDAFYDIYKAWRNAKPKYSPVANKLIGYDLNGSDAILELLKEAKAGKTRTNNSIIKVDPYYAAGVVGDENKNLWDRINFYRNRGKSDEEIRKILKKDLDKYQGNLERFKERMPSKGHGSTFYHDWANTNSFKATPSEEARALKALGIDTPEYDELERLGNFYKVFFPK